MPILKHVFNKGHVSRSENTSGVLSTKHTTSKRTQIILTRYGINNTQTTRSHSYVIKVGFQLMYVKVKMKRSAFPNSFTAGFELHKQRLVSCKQRLNEETNKLCDLLNWPILIQNVRCSVMTSNRSKSQIISNFREEQFVKHYRHAINVVLSCDALLMPAFFGPRICNK
jgi:hypothetical protein